MSTFSTLCRYSSPKLSFAISSSKSTMLTTSLISSKAIRISKLPTQINSSCWLPIIQASNLSTSQRAFCAKSEETREAESFAKYERNAKSEHFHFDKKGHKLGAIGGKAEEKTKDIISKSSADNDQDYLLPHPIWSEDEVETVRIKHKEPKGVVDNLAYYTVQIMRRTFDLASGYTFNTKLETLDERSCLIRCIFLETVAGVPGFTAAMVRHLHSLRRMQRDHGWIHTLLEEAENERMHLMTFLQLRKPGPIFRFGVIATQYVFTGTFFLAYLASPKFCHRLVGYLEEEAVKTYTHILEEIDAGRLPMWKNLPAPDIAVTYWQLPENHTMRDVILAIRADEAHHRDVNHVLASMKLRDKNPFKAGE